MSKQIASAYFLLILSLIVRTNSSGFGLIEPDYEDDDVDLNGHEITAKGYFIYSAKAKKVKSGILIIRKRKTWQEAKDFCEKCVGEMADQSDLGTIGITRNMIYNLSVYSKAYDMGFEPAEFGLDRRYWFAAKGERNIKNITKPYTWNTIFKNGDTMELNAKESVWYIGQPDNLDSNLEQCVGYWNPIYYKDNIDGYKALHWWNNFPCDHHYYFLCNWSIKFVPPGGSECKSFDLLRRNAGLSEKPKLY